jgi:DNA invertase Pin-like site-specific DNA recombinase
MAKSGLVGSGEVFEHTGNFDEIDAILVWKLDRWGRSLLDVVSTLQELNELGVGFVSLTEALDLSTTGP